MVGAGGMLGQAFYHTFREDFEVRCSDIDLNATWLEYLDFRDQKAYREMALDMRPDWIFHLGAYTDLEYCEQHKDETYVTNVESVSHAVGIANEIGCHVLYISTAGIFGGEKEVYDEEDTPMPLGVYGKTKYLGERYVLENAGNGLVCRAGWMMGGGLEKDKKFVAKIVRQIMDGQQTLMIVNDKLGTPTYTIDFARNTRLLVQQSRTGLYNMVCGGMTGRVEVAKAVVELLGKSDSVEVVEVDSGYFSDRYFAQRPACERLINRRLNDENINIMRDWREALSEYISTEFRIHFEGQ